MNTLYTNILFEQQFVETAKFVENIHIMDLYGISKETDTSFCTNCVFNNNKKYRMCARLCVCVCRMDVPILDIRLPSFFK